MFSLYPYSESFLDTLEFLLKVIGGIGGFWLFIIGFKRYAKDQSWRRNEFVAKQIKEFNSDKMVRNTKFMLDWGSRYIELFPESRVYEERYAPVTRHILKSALLSHRFKNRFTKVEVAIRDHFDNFLDYFEMFEQFLEAGLVTDKELKPYLQYWLNTISDEIEPDVRNILLHYIDQYKFTGTQNLFRRFNKNIIPETGLETTRLNAKEETDADRFSHEERRTDNSENETSTSHLSSEEER